MALPAGRYGVTKEQLRKIKRLPINTIGMITETKEGIAIVEDGAKASQLITAGRQFWHNGKLYSADVDIAKDADIITSGAGKNATEMPNITDQLPGTDAEKANEVSIARVENGSNPSATINEGEQFYHSGILYTATQDIATTDTITPNTNCQVSPSVTSQIASGVESAYQLVEDTVGCTGKNFLSLADTYNSGDLTITLTGDGGIIVNGTNGDTNSTINLMNSSNDLNKLYLHKGAYKIVATTFTEPSCFIGVYKNATSGSWEAQSQGGTNIFEVDDGDYVFPRLRVQRNTSFTNKKVYAMIMRANNIDESFEPYHPTVDAQKADNSVIGTVENGTTASQAYVVNDVFIRNGALCKVTSAISQGDTLSNQFTVTNVGAILTALLNA